MTKNYVKQRALRNRKYINEWRIKRNHINRLFCKFNAQLNIRNNIQTLTAQVIGTIAKPLKWNCKQCHSKSRQNEVKNGKNEIKNN